jgi:hypothetical protein
LFFPDAPARQRRIAVRSRGVLLSALVLFHDATITFLQYSGPIAGCLASVTVRGYNFVEANSKKNCRIRRI